MTPAPWIATLPTQRLICEFSVWSAELVRLASELDRIAPHADVLHVDAADGHFSPALLFFPDLVAAIRRISSKKIHTHLMVTDDILIEQINQFADAGSDLISIHLENTSTRDAALDVLDKRGIAAGMVLKVDTPVEAVAPYLPRLQFVTLLGTAIGIKGVELDPRATDRLHSKGLVRLGRSFASHRVGIRWRQSREHGAIAAAGWR